ncbi:hypothetical protein [Streptomyces sp. A0592]|uniref:hypothetical protein n=1 Tax=Streptomyces sp. A0592 TaxID=2563099 RepID=UPI00109ED33A|nr:hypothetical protein [Streptomyces sp. A0592]THA82733.1 hypothetical protein E6U81_19510 [Streptomyces sp. A0592]
MGINRSLLPTNEPCPRCGINKVSERQERAAWGGASQVKIGKPYCANGCTQQQLEEFEREQAGEA